MKPSCSRLTPRVEVAYAPERWAAAQSAAVAMWKTSTLEQPVARVVEPTQRVVVDHGAGDAAVGGEDAGLRLDLLGGEDAAYRGEQRDRG